MKHENAFIKTRTAVAAIILCVLAALLISGCTGSPSNTGSPSEVTDLPVLTVEPAAEPTAEPTSEPGPTAVPSVSSGDIVGVWVGGNAIFGRDWIVFYEDGRYHNDNLRTNDNARYRLEGTTLTVYELGAGRDDRVLTFDATIKEMIDSDTYDGQDIWYFENDTLFMNGFVYNRETDPATLSSYGFGE